MASHNQMFLMLLIIAVQIIFFTLAKFCFHLTYYQSTAKISLVKNLRRQGYNSQL